LPPNDRRASWGLKMPICTFIVSAYERPRQLACVLYSLLVQTERDFNIIVTDNADQCLDTVRSIDDPRIHYMRTIARDCYESANLAVLRADGEYLCFPSDDGYYAPRFLELMLKYGQGADLIYCDCIWDGTAAEYKYLDVRPALYYIDKGGFLLRRSLFTEFKGPFGERRAEDGRFIERIIQRGIKHRKAPFCGWFHN